MSRSRLLVAALVAAVALVAASCSDSDGADDEPAPATTDDGVTTTTVAPALAGWWCHPDLVDDPCTTADLTTTLVDWQLQTTVDPRPADPEAVADCFVVPPNAPDDDGALAWALAEAAPLRTRCRVFVPRIAAGAYDQVTAAFDDFLAASGADRPIFLLGHAEGADLLTRLTQERIDPDPALRARLLSVALVGGAAVQVPEGQVAGGTFQNLWLCTDRDQVGCVLSWHSYEVGTTPTLEVASFAGLAPGNRAACTHPAGLDGSRGQLRAASFPSSTVLTPGPWVPGLPAVDTPYVTLPEYFVAECVNFGSGVWYLRVEPSIDPDDQRAPGPLSDPGLAAAGLGTRNLDVVLAEGDLLFLIERQLDAWS